MTADEARADDLSNYKVCRRGDLVLNRMRAFQGALGLAPEDGIVSPDYAVLRVAPPVNGEWLAGVMKTDRFVREMNSRVSGELGARNLVCAYTSYQRARHVRDLRPRCPTEGCRHERYKQ